MSKAVANLVEAQKYAMSTRPQVGGFPYLAEVLRLAGVTQNVWYLPSCQSVYLTESGAVISQGVPLVEGFADIPDFDKEALVTALRKDQSGQSTFLEFLSAAWAAGVVSYEVDFARRRVTYSGVHGESYLEEYPLVQVEYRT